MMNTALQNYGHCVPCHLGAQGCCDTARANTAKMKLSFGALLVGGLGGWVINEALNSDAMQRTFDDSELLPSGQTKKEKLATIGSIAVFYAIGVLLGSTQRG